MKKHFDITLKSRQRLHKILSETSKEDLLKIPTNFNNNIWWNIAHVLVTEQLLVYKFSGLESKIPASLIDKFKKGTVPDGSATDEEIQQVKELLISTVENTQNDFENGVFKNYNAYTTSANVTLECVEDALVFNVLHEGLHIGAIISLQKML
ncbi:DinB family protein [Aurantibacter crassamenti]|uniref:DinB family protein n=1 Tax=Aurantibacter crassamenti TaxID=1837375 RepID=UPI00193934AA|nr:DinB family protein [Aurantibacter crassamenti]MBM1104918.1 DinB family protein [Aurantibacter crassamenti]